MPTNTTQPWWISSEGSGLALRVKSFLLGLVPLVLITLNIFGIDIAEEQILEIIGAIVELVAVAMFIYAWVRRNTNKKLGRGKFA